jgi:putative endonuclease
MPDPSAWFLYLIECEGGSIYTGITTDIERRFAEHVGGIGARYTRSHRPIRILASMPFANRSEASRAENAVKRLSPTQKRKLGNELEAGTIEPVLDHILSLRRSSRES